MRRITHLRNSPDHQVGRVRPRLRRVDHDARQRDAGFFPNFAADGVFDGLGRLNEPRQGGVPVGGEAFGAAEEDAFGICGDDGHDDGGVGAGEGKVRYRGAGVAGGSGGGFALLYEGSVAWWTGAFGPAVYGDRRVAAGAAEGVAGIPVYQGAGLGVDSGLDGCVSDGCCIWGRIGLSHTFTGGE